MRSQGPFFFSRTMAGTSHGPFVRVLHMKPPPFFQRHPSPDPCLCRVVDEGFVDLVFPSEFSSFRCCSPAVPVGLFCNAHFLTSSPFCGAFFPLCGRALAGKTRSSPLAPASFSPAFTGSIIPVLGGHEPPDGGYEFFSCPFFHVSPRRLSTDEEVFQAPSLFVWTFLGFMTGITETRCMFRFEGTPFTF